MYRTFLFIAVAAVLSACSNPSLTAPDLSANVERHKGFEFVGPPCVLRYTATGVLSMICEGQAR